MLIQQQHFIIDFDSTIVSVEALDELAKIVLSEFPQNQLILKKIEQITKDAMEGEIPFPRSLEERMQLFTPTADDIDALILLLKHAISKSFRENKEFFTKYREQIYIISGGFKEYIYPVLSEFDILQNHILANEFVFDTKKRIIGYDKENLLAQELGKVNAVKKLNLPGNVIVIGDGHTDLQIKEMGAANEFIAYTEHIARPIVISKADKIIKNFDEFLHEYHLPRKLSYPKSKIKVLLLENIHFAAIQLFKDEEYQIESINTSLSDTELISKIADVSLLGIRSKTEITKNILNHAKKLLAIGAYCIGVNQIDINYAAHKGIAVFNAPYSNTRSVVELVMGEIIVLYRNIIDKNAKLHKGIWDKSAKNSFEVRGKSLGIIGYGNIGAQLSVLAENFGMKVYFYDINDKLALGNAIKCSTLEELLAVSDVITVHVDGRKSNKQLISEKEFCLMKKGIIFLNLSRGITVDLEALATYVTNGKILGCAIDVFPEEPKNNDEKLYCHLQGLPNVILTPHIGGSTEEAQRSIGNFVSNKLVTFINTGNTTLSVNFPNLTLPNQSNVHRLIHIHKNGTGILAAINKVLASNSINIEGQYLKTNEDIGYVITDVHTTYNTKVLSELKTIPLTIKVRVLY